MKFSNIPKFPQCGYNVSIGWDFLEGYINKKRCGVTLNMNPEYQRGHVWTEQQQIDYVEYCIRGGEAGRVILTNCPGWMGDFRGPFELVDGKQRIEAVRKFLRNDLKVFGYTFSDYEDSFYVSSLSFDWRVFDLQKKEDILKLYLDINSGETPHAKEEIERVRLLLKGAENANRR